MLSDLLTVAVSLLAIAVTLVIAVRGWARDQAGRDDALRAECLRHLVALSQSRIEPLFSDEWTQQHAVAANTHHISAIAAMQGVSRNQQELRLVRRVADSTFYMQEECVRYRRSAEAQMDRMNRRTGRRRGAILAANVQLQQDLLLWQQGKKKWFEVGTFSLHYFDELGLPSKIPNDDDEWFERLRH